MKIFFTLILLLCFSLTSKTFADTNSTKISSYNFHIECNGGNKLHIKAVLKIDKENNDNNLSLLTNKNSVYQNIKLIEGGNAIDIPFAETADTLTLKLPPTLIRQKEIRVSFVYTFTFDSLYNGVRSFNSWYPYLWNNISKYKIISQTPADYSLLFPGVTLKKKLKKGIEENVSEMNKPIPRLFMVVAKTTSYRVDHSIINGTKLTFCFYHKDEDILTGFKKESSAAFKFFNDYLGKYRYKSLTFIEIPDFSGVNSQPGFIMMGSMLMTLYRMHIYDWVPHEIAHQWFGSGTFSRHNDLKSWCVFEPLAEYLRLTCAARDSGNAYIKREINDMIDEYKSDYLNKPEDKPLTESGASRVTYIKGTYVMDYIQQICGKQNWQLFLQRLYKNYKGRFLTYEGFLKCLNGINPKASKKFIELTNTKGFP